MANCYCEVRENRRFGEQNQHGAYGFGWAPLADLNAKPADGDLMAVHYPNTDEATLRRLCLDGPVKRFKLISNEQDYDICDEHTRIQNPYFMFTFLHFNPITLTFGVV